MAGDNDVMQMQIDFIKEQNREVLGKLDGLTKVMISLAQTEERILSVMQHNQRQDERLDAHDRRLSALFDRLNKSENKAAYIMGIGTCAMMLGSWLINLYFSSGAPH